LIRRQAVPSQRLGVILRNASASRKYVAEFVLGLGYPSRSITLATFTRIGIVSVILWYVRIATKDRLHRPITNLMDATMRPVFQSLLASAFFAMASVAVAGPFEDGQAAYDRHDYATALQVWQPLADHGDS
jgi:hypothetical protein